MSSINTLLTNAFKFTIDRGHNNIELFCQAAGLPGVKLSTQPQPTTLGTQIPIATNTFTFDPLLIEFFIDQNLDNWKSIYDWMKAIGNISDASSEPYQDWATEARLIPMNPSLCPIGNRTITFYHVIPVDLGGIGFKADVNDPTQTKCRVAFAYSYYSF
jgi:hypothetical protein